MEKTMSRNNDTSTLGPATQVRELRDDELQHVSGGVNLENVQITSFVSRGTGYVVSLGRENSIEC